MRGIKERERVYTITKKTKEKRNSSVAWKEPEEEKKSTLSQNGTNEKGNIFITGENWTCDNWWKENSLDYYKKGLREGLIVAKMDKNWICDFMHRTKEGKQLQNHRVGEKWKNNYKNG